MISRPHWFAGLIMAMFVVFTVRSSAATPLGEPPDEGADFLYAHNLLVTGELPVMTTAEAMFASGSTKIHHPPLYYLISAALIAPIDRSDAADFLRRNPFGTPGTVSVANVHYYLHPPQSVLNPHSGTLTAFWIMRLLSLSFACGTLWCIYRAGSLAFDARVGLLAMLLTAAIPTFVFLSGSANNDNLVTFCVALGMYVSLRAWKHGISPATILLSGVALGAAALTKVSGFGLFAGVFCAAVLGAWLGHFSWRRALIWLVGAGLITALIAGWWYVRNSQLYGDFLATRASAALWGRGDRPLTWAEFEGTWMSFWMVLGHFNIRGPDWVYWYATGLTALGLGGLALSFLAAPPQATQPALRGVRGLLLLFAAGNLAVFLLIMLQAAAGQGRVLFPMLVGFSPLLAYGLLKVFRRLAFLTVVPLLVVCALMPTETLAPAYPPLIEAAPPQRESPLLVRAESLAITGYQLAQREVRAGETLAFTLYFSGNHAENAHFFAALRDAETEQVLAVVDTFPGMSPTDVLRAEGQYAALIKLPVPPAAAPTDQARPLQVVMGWRVLRTDRYVPLVDGNGTPLSALVLEAGHVVR